jgi:TetR/AcrR family transcriptional regulator, mexJK operon transcriptional repressor
VDSVVTGVSNSTIVPNETGSRSERKRNAILDAATQAFLGNGYSRTSMDEIARLARVSKQTVYMHFGDKERLLYDIVMTIVNRASHPVDDDIQRLGDSTDLGTDLRDHARRQLALILQPQPMQLRRLVIAEAVSFPELGRAFYDLGPGRTIGELAKAIQRLTERGLLNATDPARAASDLNWLIMSDPLNQAMLRGDDGPPDPTSIAQWADQAVTTFLAAYSPTRAVAPTTDDSHLRPA